MSKLKMLFSLLLMLAVKTFASGPRLIQSPDKKVNFKVFIKDDQLFYSMSFMDKAVVEPSAIRMSLDKSDLTRGMIFGKTESYKLKESYPWYGVHAVAHNEFMGAKIELVKGKDQYILDVRVFDNGAAFRLVIPGKENVLRTPDENTVFTFPEGTSAWYHDLYMHYEGLYAKKQMDLVQAGEWAAPSVTLQLKQGLYVTLTEADLKNYGGMALQTDGERGLVLRLPSSQPTSYPYKLRYSAADALQLSKPAVISGTVCSPWRVLMIGTDLNALVNNDMVHNLCPAPDSRVFPKGIYTEWIKPGAAVWKYLDGGGESTLANLKEFSRMAAELGFKHNILEGFWSKWPDQDLKELVEYSRSKGVGIWLWEHSKNLRKADQRMAFFKHCHDLGIAGLKIDFFDHEAKAVTDLYQDILKETAGLKLMVDFHGANKPTGQERTWPNEMTREAVKGMEASKLADRASHEVTLPFTRFIAGHAEYTPVHFGDRRKNTSWAHQIASAAILSAPMLTYAASPQHLLVNPGVEMIKSIPSVWDETIVLPGSAIGGAAIYARRKGNTWFLAVMNGTKPASFKILLSFLGAGRFKASEVRDVIGNTGDVSLSSREYNSSDVVELRLGEGGGYISRFVNLNN